MGSVIATNGSHVVIVIHVVIQTIYMRVWGTVQIDVLEVVIVTG